MRPDQTTGKTTIFNCTYCWNKIWHPFSTTYLSVDNEYYTIFMIIILWIPFPRLVGSARCYPGILIKLLIIRSVAAMWPGQGRAQPASSPSQPSHLQSYHLSLVAVYIYYLSANVSTVYIYYLSAVFAPRHDADFMSARPSPAGVGSAVVALGNKELTVSCMHSAPAPATWKATLQRCVQLLQAAPRQYPDCRR